MTLFLKVSDRKPDPKRMEKAAKVLRKGGLVIFPTETVYGIGADATNPKACAGIFSAKGRARDNPLIVHVSSMEMAEKVGIIPRKYLRAIRKTWPAPITFVVVARPGLPKVVTAGLKTVCIRMPDNMVALSLIKKTGVPIAAPSANPSTKPSATSGRHALMYFKGKVDVILDAGKTKHGIESTILDLRDFKVLRPGSFTVEQIAKAFGKRPRVTNQTRGLEDSKKVTTPGMKYRHYSPERPLFLYEGKREKLPEILKGMKDLAFIGSKETSRLIRSPNVKRIILGSRKNTAEMASNLFDALIRLDSLKVRFGIVESFAEKGEGLAIMNRLRKASSHNSFKTGRELKKLLLQGYR